MTDAAAPPDEPYHESADYSWTETAFNMLESNDLHGEVVSRDEIVRSRVWGPCPRCGHDLDDQQTHTAVMGLMGGQSRGPGRTDAGQPDATDTGVPFFPVDVSCGCGDNHPGAPAGQSGCGVSFRVELPLRSVDSSGQP
ncbi:MAG: hypothetical protein ACLQDY_21075 [Streptosporangiaceae bacterium]